MTTNVVGDQARQFNWQMVHYLVKGGPNDPESQTNLPPTSGGVLSWNSAVGRPPLEGPLTPPAQQVPRLQSLLSGGTNTTGASTTGGILVGTIPQGAWIESVEAMLYAAWVGGTVTGFGLYYSQAGAFSTANAPNYVPTQVQPLAYFTGAGGAGTLYSTEFIASAAPRAAWTAAVVGPGNGNSGSLPQNLASLFDIDIWAIVYSSTPATPLTAGAMSCRVKFTGLEG